MKLKLGTGQIETIELQSLLLSKATLPENTNSLKGEWLRGEDLRKESFTAHLAWTELPRDVFKFGLTFPLSLLSPGTRGQATSWAGSGAWHCPYGAGFAGLQNARITDSWSLVPRLPKIAEGQTIWSVIGFTEEKSWEAYVKLRTWRLTCSGDRKMFRDARMWSICQTVPGALRKDGLRDPMCNVDGGAAGARPPKLVRAQMMSQVPDVTWATTFGFALLVFILAVSSLSLF